MALPYLGSHRKMQGWVSDQEREANASDEWIALGWSESFAAGNLDGSDSEHRPLTRSPCIRACGIVRPSSRVALASPLQQ